MLTVNVEINVKINSGETRHLLCSGNCSARGLALVAAALANKGSVMGVEVLSEAAWEQLHRDPVPATIFNIFPTNFSQVILYLVCCYPSGVFYEVRYLSECFIPLIRV